MKITKNILSQYSDIKQEVTDLRKRIEQNRKELEKIENSGFLVSDTVKGTTRDGRVGNIKITGVPLPHYEKVKALLKRRIAKLELLEEDLLESLNAVDDYIESIEKSELRIMFRLYYVDDLKWVHVAMKMNGLFPKKNNVYTDESCRKKHDRYLLKREKSENSVKP